MKHWTIGETRKFMIDGIVAVGELQSMEDDYYHIYLLTPLAHFPRKDVVHLLKKCVDFL